MTGSGVRHRRRPLAGHMSADRVGGAVAACNARGTTPSGERVAPSSDKTSPTGGEAWRRDTTASRFRESPDGRSLHRRFWDTPSNARAVRCQVAERHALLAEARPLHAGQPSWAWSRREGGAELGTDGVFNLCARACPRRVRKRGFRAGRRGTAEFWSEHSRAKSSLTLEDQAAIIRIAQGVGKVLALAWAPP